MSDFFKQYRLKDLYFNTWNRAENVKWNKGLTNNEINFITNEGWGYFGNSDMEYVKFINGENFDSVPSFDFKYEQGTYKSFRIFSPIYTISEDSSILNIEFNIFVQESDNTANTFTIYKKGVEEDIAIKQVDVDDTIANQIKNFRIELSNLDLRAGDEIYFDFYFSNCGEGLKKVVSGSIETENEIFYFPSEEPPIIKEYNFTNFNTALLPLKPCESWFGGNKENQKNNECSKKTKGKLVSQADRIYTTDNNKRKIGWGAYVKEYGDGGIDGAQVFLGDSKKTSSTIHLEENQTYSFSCNLNSTFPIWVFVKINKEDDESTCVFQAAKYFKTKNTLKRYKCDFTANENTFQVAANQAGDYKITFFFGSDTGDRREIDSTSASFYDAITDEVSYGGETLIKEDVVKYYLNATGDDFSKQSGFIYCVNLFLANNSNPNTNLIDCLFLYKDLKIDFYNNLSSFAINNAVLEEKGLKNIEEQRFKLAGIDNTSYIDKLKNNGGYINTIIKERSQNE